jgi:Uma2 family endonuclease
MAASLSNRERVRETTDKWVWSKPLSFTEFLALFPMEEQVELVNGVVVEKTMVQLDHEKLLLWLLSIANIYARQRQQGLVLGSRTAVEISRFGARLPDLLFVRQERMEIVQQKAIYGAPDLVIEIVSPNDRPSDIITLETDYRAIGVDEIVFIDQKKRRLRVLHKGDADYTEQTLTEGTFASQTLSGLRLELVWLFDEPRPKELDVLNRLLTDTE